MLKAKNMLAGDLILLSYQLTQSQERCQASTAWCKSQCFGTVPLSLLLQLVGTTKKNKQRPLNLTKASASGQCLLILTHNSSLFHTLKSNQAICLKHCPQCQPKPPQLHNFFRLVRLWRNHQDFVVWKNGGPRGQEGALRSIQRRTWWLHFFMQGSEEFRGFGDDQ